MMTVYIVYYKTGHMIESVWSSQELADSAICYHVHFSKRLHQEYVVIPREVNTARMRNHENQPKTPEGESTT